MTGIITNNLRPQILDSVDVKWRIESGLNCRPTRLKNLVIFLILETTSLNSIKIFISSP